MKFEDIEVGKTYNIQYIDPNYPCRCPCHTTPGMMHCVPCCYDMSYTGPAKCFDKRPPRLIDFITHEWRDGAGRHVLIFPENVLDKVEE